MKITDKWEDYEFTDEEIESEKYKEYIGSGASWDGRGEFQVELLKWVGMKNNSVLLDFGCGPFRAAPHFIKFLDKDCYIGTDINKIFIKICKDEVGKNQEFSLKNPSFCVSDGLPVDIGRIIDFMIVFSVINHFGDQQRKDFFSKILSAKSIISKDAKIVVTNAQWINLDFINFLSKDYFLTIYAKKEISLPIDNWYNKFGLANKNFPILVLSLR